MSDQFETVNDTPSTEDEGQVLTEQLEETSALVDCSDEDLEDITGGRTPTPKELVEMMSTREQLKCIGNAAIKDPVRVIRSIGKSVMKVARDR